MRILALAALLLALPVALAQATEPVRPLSFLVYHAEGGAQPDPLATPLTSAFAASRMPVTLFDRAERAASAPEGAPASAPAHYREFQRLVERREAGGAPIALAMEGEARPDALELTLEATALGAFEPGAVNVSFVLFEHGALAEGRPQPYVARAATAPQRLLVNGTLEQEIQLDPAWALDRIGVVAIAEAGDVVLQSVTWMPARGGFARSVDKTVLVEHVTATWCNACAPADDALGLLAAQRGVAGPLDAGATHDARAPGVLFYVGLAIGGLASVALFRRRAA